MDTPRSSAGAPLAPELFCLSLAPFVFLDDVHYAYPASAPGVETPAVLRGVSLSLAEGECVALLGQTGAGKSTLCLTLNGIIPQLLGGTFCGRVRIGGRNVGEGSPGELSHTVGLVFQDPDSQFITMTVEDEVAFGLESLALPRREIESRISQALEMTGVAALRARSPMELSGGEKQRVALASVLAMRPRVLVLDEPTTSLDPAGKRSLLDVVASLRVEGGTTTLWVTQDVDQVPMLADRVAVLHDGRIALDGGLREILRQEKTLRGMGLRAPQMVELGSRFDSLWNSDCGWLTVEEAAQGLKEKLDG